MLGGWALFVGDSNCAILLGPNSFGHRHQQQQPNNHIEWIVWRREERHADGSIFTIYHPPLYYIWRVVVGGCEGLEKAK
jgi:hypothetical protein